MFLIKAKLLNLSVREFVLKGTWGQSNNFCLKWSYFFIKQNDISQNFQKFTCKLQLAYLCMFIWDDDVIHIETQFNYSKLHMFSKNGQKQHKTL